MSKLLKRSEIPINHTSDLTRLFKTESDYEQALIEVKGLADDFVSKYQNKFRRSARGV